MEKTMKVEQIIEFQIWNSCVPNSLIPATAKESLQETAITLVNAQIAEGYREGRFSLEVDECPDETFTCGWSVRRTTED